MTRPLAPVLVAILGVSIGLVAAQYDGYTPEGSNGRVTPAAMAAFARLATGDRDAANELVAMTATDADVARGSEESDTFLQARVGDETSAQRGGDPPERRKDFHTRGRFREDYIWPKCTGPSTRFEYGDGTSFTACTPDANDNVFGKYSEWYQSLAGQSMSFIPLDNDHFHEEKAIAKELFLKYAAAYVPRGPGGIGIGTYVRDIFLLYALKIGGGEAAGAYFYEPGDTLWLSMPDVQEIKKRFLMTLHHETAHLLEERLVGQESKDDRAVAWRQKWLATLPDNFVYTPKNYARMTYWYTPLSYEQGFLTGYNRASFAEDVAQFMSNLIVGHPELWKCYDKSERCKRKVTLAMELYQMIAPGYNFEYFTDIKKQAHASNMHVVFDGPRPLSENWLSGEDEIKRIDESYPAYVKKTSELDRKVRSFPDPEPKFGVQPRLIKVGEDTVALYIETTPGKKIYGNTEMSQRATYIPEKEENVPRTLAFIKTWQEWFEYGVGGVLKRVVSVGGLRTPGEVHGVYFPDPGDTLWMGPHITTTNRVRGETEWTADNHGKKWSTTLAHESIHLIAQNFYSGKLGGRDPVAWRKEWVTANPRGFEYLGKGAPDTGLEFTPKFYQDGFVSGYCRVSLDEDIAQVGAAIVVGAKEIWECAAVSPICLKKTKLALELLGLLDHRYTSQYFRSRSEYTGDSAGPQAAAAAEVRKEDASAGELLGTKLKKVDKNAGGIGAEVQDGTRASKNDIYSTNAKPDERNGDKQPKKKKLYGRRRR